MSDLIKRLRKPNMNVLLPDERVTLIFGIMREAADRIEELEVKAFEFAVEKNAALTRIEELEGQNKNRGAAVVLAQEVIAKNDKRIEELEAACEIIADAFAESDADCADKEDKLHAIENWCKAYPRTVFIEPTKEGWKRAAEVLDDADDCPSLGAISGSNMRHVVEGIQALAALDKDSTANPTTHGIKSVKLQNEDQ